MNTPNISVFWGEIIEFELEYYLDGLKYTVKMIKELLKNDNYDYYCYQSSWWLKWM